MNSKIELTTVEARTPRAPTAKEVRDAFFSAPHSYVEVGPCRLAYRCFGSGPDVVFIHGWPLHSATFRNIVPTLAQNFRCHLLDLPGAGLSLRAPAEMVHVPTHVETMRSALRQLGISKYALVAQDSGALIARMLAAQDQNATALIFSGSEIPGHHPLLLKLFLTAAKLNLDDAVTAALRRPFVQRSLLGFGGCFDDLRHTQGDFHKLFVAPLLRDVRGEVSPLALLRRFDWSFVDRLVDAHAQIRVPVLMIWGERDPYFPAAKAQKMASQFAGKTEFVCIPRARLLVHEEHAQDFADRARVFLLQHALA